VGKACENGLDEGATNKLLDQEWKGNVTELKSVAERKLSSGMLKLKKSLS
jgi:DNA-binding NtrC family response regulator